MQLNLEELNYLQEVLEQATQYTKARGEQVEHPSVSHDELLNKIKQQIHKISSWVDTSHLTNTMWLSMITHTTINHIVYVPRQYTLT